MTDRVKILLTILLVAAIAVLAIFLVQPPEQAPAQSSAPAQTAEAVPETPSDT